ARRSTGGGQIAVSGGYGLPESSKDPGIEPYQVLVRFFAGWVRADGAPCVLKSALEVTLPLQLRHELVERLEIPLRQPPPLLQDPGFEVAGEQFTPIQLKRLDEPVRLLGAAGGLGRGLECRFELRHVSADGRRV